MTDSDPLRPVFDAVSAAPDALAKFQALKTHATQLAIPIRHGLLDFYEIEERLLDLAHTHGLIEELTLGAVELAVRNALTTPPLSDGPAKTNGGRGRIDRREPSWRDHVFTAAALRAKSFPPISYVVPDLIPEGLSIIAGRPKIGKSWLALDLCIAVSAGRMCLGERQPVQGDVLYAALEDNPRRLQRRIDKLLSPFGAQWPERLTLATSWRRLDKGGVEDIAQWTESVAEPRLCILDTLAGVRPIRTREGYTEDYKSVAALHRMAKERDGLGVLALHHTRKMEAEDPIDTISGTLGLPGCVDTALVVARTSKGTTLYVRGRDIEEAEYAIIFDKHSCRWSILGNASDVQRSQERGRILEVLDESPKALSPQDIVKRTGMQPNSVWQLLHKMALDGQVAKAARGRYRHPDHPAPKNKESAPPGKEAKAVRSDEK